MARRADSWDLDRLGLSSGEGRRHELAVAIEPLQLSGEPYAVRPVPVPALVDVARLTGGGYSLRLRFSARLSGPCMRCLQPAEVELRVDAREIDQPGEDEELRSPYVRGGVLDLHAWARDALALSLPAQLLCDAGCAGLCAVCGVNLNEVVGEHVHERTPDPRWAKLRELR